MEGMNGKSAKISGPRPLPSTLYLLTSSFYHPSEQMKNREKWRLIIQEAKAHPEL
jgi:ribosomal protein S10